MQLARTDDGKLIKYAWPGGYPVYYLFADNEVCCADCANGENRSIARTDPSDCPDDKQWTIVASEINYEDNNLYCSHCGAKIDSAYGDHDE